MDFKTEYILSPTAFCNLLEMEPLMSVYFSRSHKCYLVTPTTEQDEFYIMMCSGTEMGGRIDVDALVQCISLWTNLSSIDRAEVNQAVTTANIYRRKAKKREIGII